MVRVAVDAMYWAQVRTTPGATADRIAVILKSTVGSLTLGASHIPCVPRADDIITDNLVELGEAQFPWEVNRSPELEVLPEE